MIAPRLTFVLGGARSGKSRYAEELVAAEPAPWCYIATAQAFDDEMRARIAEHRSRRDARWQTSEAPLGLPGALAAAAGPVLVDCLTLWLTNLMLGEHPLAPAFDRLEAAIAAASGPVVMVSNEVGLSIVPDNALARAFRDDQGRLNQRVARLADRVIFMVAGLPMVVK
ncbi:bifunctional adenosylcobinamide kinase/adenosylcobinamide-phosphate guanylyltransferase [Labrys monachus]|uniref:Bifunctional adenosylcobalamin biosynthesis protein n=1 Tax=Labrys monachus TaxID=217067 RepID=A0ABU0FEE3_9HYPH|nr:bifunctional adenosylcobinamide kinase/adenosylcobinamide-phosphate guanylyltransferase [Labrys monachus]MDQ0392493.1 adenosylcobinamide kinase/adenosylcobinamide-phosphate guanylyltransferase [Labrys monachus]